MRVSLGYGSSTKEVEIPEHNLSGVLHGNNVDTTRSETEILLQAIENPIGTGRLKDSIRCGAKIAIIVSDITRPVPTAKILPLLLEELGSAGILDCDITIVFARGIHRQQNHREMLKITGEDIYLRIQCVDSNPEDCVLLGYTQAETPVEITREVAQADFRIAIGNIEYHYFAGYSGGAKALVPGVSSANTIRSNHSLMVLPGSCVGNLESNPLRHDLEEAISFCRLDFILNVILDDNKRIIGAVAGHFQQAHRIGCRMLDDQYKIRISQKSDIVIASQGGYPKDINVYQLQKALENANLAVRDGGVIILVGRCEEGFGESTFEKWIMEAREPDELIRRIQKDFQLGGHKAAAIALVLKRVRVFMVSDMKPDLVRSLFFEPFHDVQDALNAALSLTGTQSKILVMPHAGSTMPTIS